MAHRSDDWLIAHTHNTARFFTENRHIAWMVLVATVVWGVFGFLKMPQRKDPDVPVKVALAIAAWPGVDATRVEELVTRRIEETMAENVTIDEITSTTRLGVAFVYVTLKQSVEDPAKEFDDLSLRLDGIRDLPDGAGPITFIRDFGSTAALMLTVASPAASEVEVAIRARSIRTAIERVRGDTAAAPQRATLVFVVPPAVPATTLRRSVDQFVGAAGSDGTLSDPRVVMGNGFVGVDGVTSLDDGALLAYLHAFVERTLRAAEIHPDVWPPVVVRDPRDAAARLAAAGADRYSYRQLEAYTDLIRRSLQTIPLVTKVSRAGVLDEQVLLNFSQERLAAYGIRLTGLADRISARNIPVTGGTIEVQGRTLAISPTGEFQNEREIADMIVGASPAGTPVYLRDLGEVIRTYETATYLNFFTSHDAAGRWHRSRAITVSVQMRAGAQIAEFGAAVDSALATLRDRLPEDLILARTSDEPRQVVEKIDLFMNSLVEAILLVVLVALLGFWEWRSAVVLSLSIPLTLAMTFGMMSLLGIDLQQVSIASLIIALGLLVDDPVVAADAIKRDLVLAHPPLIASWLGPTKLATAIVYATITNIVAYLPFLLLTGDMGRFLYSLPIVLTCSLVASRLVSMTFIPLLGYYLLRPGRKPETPLAERRVRGFTGWYYRLGHRAIEHRWKALAIALGVLVAGFAVGSRIKPSFLPKDLAYIATADVWLPEDASLTATLQAATLVEALVHEVAGEYGREHAEDAPGHPVLRSVTTFVGGGGPRFWFSITPEPEQTNYAQVIIEVYDKHATPHLVERLQELVAARIAGARINVKELETGTPVGAPVAVRITGDDLGLLRREAERLKAVFRAVPIAERVQDDWGSESFAVRMRVNADRASLAGVTNMDVAASTAVALNGYRVGMFREGDAQIPIVARLRAEERSELTDLQNLYVYASQGTQRVPLRQISALDYDLRPAKINRRTQFRTITVLCYPVHGRLPSEVMAAAQPGIEAFAAGLPPGFRMTIGGEQAEQEDGFGELGMVMVISIALIYVALVLQFRNTVKPLLVFAAIPFGMVGALVALWVTGTPFGFMAFLGVASLVGVIVSHVIVLFDFIEEARERGTPFIEAVLDAGIVRLRPVLITVGATVLALFPLAGHGGPFWQPMCYAQIGGLAFATVVTLLLVPVLYAIFVLDLKIVRWEADEAPGAHGIPA